MVAIPCRNRAEYKSMRLSMSNHKINHDSVKLDAGVHQVDSDLQASSSMTPER